MAASSFRAHVACVVLYKITEAGAGEGKTTKANRRGKMWDAPPHQLQKMATPQTAPQSQTVQSPDMIRAFALQSVTTVICNI